MKHLLLFLLFFPVLLLGQTQIGADICGEYPTDQSGQAVSLSANGKRLAIGAPSNTENGGRRGHVRIYADSAGTWVQVGNDIDGKSHNTSFGRSLSLSADGTRIAIGASHVNSNFLGDARIYADSAGTWVQIGVDTAGQFFGDSLGRIVSLSPDGTRVAIGAPFYSGWLGQNGHGLVRIYTDSAGIWTKVGRNIRGEASFNRSGSGLSLSTDGTCLAIGAPSNDGENGLSSGHVRVFKESGGTWTQAGDDIDGEAAGDNSGKAISLSADGTRLAIGAIGNNDANGNNAGHVRIYDLSGGMWTQVGNDIDGVAGDYLGYSVSLSSDGTRLAIGLRGNDDIAFGAGQVRVYAERNGAWVQVVQNINGEADRNWSGESVSLSADGTRLAIGAPGNNDCNGDYAGYVRVYDLNPNFVSGIVFRDDNGNGVQDAGEPGISNYSINTTGGPVNQVFTQSNGAFSFPVIEGLNYSFQLAAGDCNPIFTTPSSYALTYSPDSTYQLNFGLQLGDGPADLRVFLNSGTIRCGFEHDFWLTVINDGCQPLAGESTVTFPPEMTFISSDVAPLVTEDALVALGFDTLQPSASQRFRVRFQMPDETFAGLPIILGAAAGAMTGSGTLVEADTFVYSEILRCAIDPNDKQVSPSRPEPTNSNYTQIDETLRYTIRFQNTGNDTAFTVRIEDQISESLNLETFKPLTASHPYSVSVHEDRKVTFLFEDILLPDSTTNLPGSQGFVTFEIDPHPDLEDFSTIDNTAGIFFDFNQPVITNTVQSTFVEFLNEDQDAFLFYEECDDTNREINPAAEEIPGNGIDEDCDGEDRPVSTIGAIQQNIRFFPNPTSQVVRLYAPQRNTYTVTVLDAMGRRIRSITLSNAEAIDLSDQPNGVYLLQLKDERNGKIGYRRVVVQR